MRRPPNGPQSRGKVKLLLSSKAAQAVSSNALYRFYSAQDALTFAHDLVFLSIPEHDFQDL
jgi:hypothetical protein